MKSAAPRRNRRRGMALLLVLVVIMALTLIVGALWQSSQPGWEQNTRDRAEFQAGWLAESGLALALHPEIEAGDVALRHDFAPERGYEARITSESSRMPVNEIAADFWRDAAVELFLRWGLDASEAERVADSLADWADTDEEPRANGAEKAFYAGYGFDDFPTNGPFTSIEEMLFVAGMDEVARVQPMWRDYFTIHSDGLVDLNAAPWEIVAAVTGASADAARNLVAVRSGDDGIGGTIDDYRIEDVGEAQGLLGLTTGEWGEVSGFVSLFGGVRRIESTGRIGEFETTRVALVQEVSEDGNTRFIVLARFRQ